MNSKNILILSPFFFPEPISTGKFNTDIAIGLKNNGHKVTVLCSYPIYPNWAPNKCNDELPGIKIVRGGAKVKYTKNPILRRIILESWYAYYVFKSFFKLKNYDIIVPVFPPSLFFYIIIPLINKKSKVVGMVHDLQEVYSKGKKGGLSKLISFLINKIEGRALRKCDKLIFLSNEMKSTAKKFYNLDERKLVVNYPFSNLEEQSNQNKLDSVFDKTKRHVVYSGALSEKQNPYELYEFFNYASKHIQDCDFHFFSQGQIYEILKNKNVNKNINFHSLVPKDCIAELYSKSTVQIVPQSPGTSKGSLPSKLPNILVSNCKVLVITDKNSEIEKLFLDYNIDKVVTNWDYAVLLDALKELVNNGGIIDAGPIEEIKTVFSLKSMIESIV